MSKNKSEYVEEEIGTIIHVYDLEHNTIVMTKHDDKKKIGFFKKVSTPRYNQEDNGFDEHPVFYFLGAIPYITRLGDSILDGMYETKVVDRVCYFKTPASCWATKDFKVWTNADEDEIIDKLRSLKIKDIYTDYPEYSEVIN